MFSLPELFIYFITLKDETKFKPYTHPRNKILNTFQNFRRAPKPFPPPLPPRAMMYLIVLTGSSKCILEYEAKSVV